MEAYKVNFRVESHEHRVLDEPHNHAPAGFAGVDRAAVRGNASGATHSGDGGNTTTTQAQPR